MINHADRNIQQEQEQGMPKFRDFEEVLEHYQLDFRYETFLDFAKIAPVPAENWFKEELMFSLSNRGADDKEAFVCEFLIVPFLKHIWKRHRNINLFSHVQIKADDLILIPDYLVSKKTPTGFKRVYKPLLLTVEAKNEQFDEGWFKVLLQSIVCQQINATDKIPILVIVTTGDVWQFGKLDQQHFIRHPLPLSIEDPEALLGVLDVLFAECERQTINE